MENYCRAIQATDENAMLEHCMLDTQGYKKKLRILNTYCSSTATMVARTHLNVMLHLHRLSGLKFFF
jgi:hypothetical protein